MTTPIEVRDTAIQAVKKALPRLRECEGHPGRFNLDEIKRFLTLAPAIRLAFLGISGFSAVDVGYVDCECQYAAFVVTEGTQRMPGGEGAANIVTALVPLIHNNDWGLAGVGPAVLNRAENLYGGDIDARGAALWALAWTQTVRLGADVFADADLAGIVLQHLYVSVNGNPYEDAATGEAAPDVR